MKTTTILFWLHTDNSDYYGNENNVMINLKYVNLRLMTDRAHHW